MPAAQPTPFDADLADARLALQAVAQVRSQRAGERQALQGQLDAAAGEVARLQGELRTANQAVADAEVAVGTADTAVHDRLADKDTVAREEPSPATHTIPNVAYGAWVDELAALARAVDDARSKLPALEADLDRAQENLDNVGPEPPDEILSGGNWIPNPKHAIWLAKKAALEARRDEAQDALTQQEQAVAKAQSDHDAVAAAPPPQTVEIPTPAHLAWSLRMGSAELAYDNAVRGLTARRGERDNALRTRDAISGSLSTAGSEVVRLQPLVSAASAALDAADARVRERQAEVDRWLRWIGVLVSDAGDPATVAAVVLELGRRLKRAEDLWRGAIDPAADAQEATWRMVNRVAELERGEQAMVDALEEIYDAQLDYRDRREALRVYDLTEPVKDL